MTNTTTHDGHEMSPVSGEAAPLEGAAMTHATTEHAGPHIPGTQGQAIDGWSVAGSPITTTIFSTWIFMALLFIGVAAFRVSLSKCAHSRLTTCGLDIVGRLDTFLTSALGDRAIARKFLPLVG